MGSVLLCQFIGEGKDPNLQNGHRNDSLKEHKNHSLVDSC